MNQNCGGDIGVAIDMDIEVSGGASCEANKAIPSENCAIIAAVRKSITQGGSPGSVHAVDSDDADAASVAEILAIPRVLSSKVLRS